MEITHNDIRLLIALGSNDDTADSAFCSYFRTRDFINRESPEAWWKVVADLSNADLVYVFKALVKLERDLKWCGGSVAGAIWVYRVIDERQIDRDHSIAEFGLQNCDNGYVPFGRSRYGTRTYVDYIAYGIRKSDITSQKAERYEMVLKRVNGRKYKRADAIAELRRLSFEQRGLIKREYLEKYSLSTKSEHLEMIAGDLKFPPEYYPVEWIEITKEEIRTLPNDLIKKLSDKLSTKTRGKWKRFALMLRQFDDGS